MYSIVRRILSETHRCPISCNSIAQLRAHPFDSLLFDKYSVTERHFECEVIRHFDFLDILLLNKHWDFVKFVINYWRKNTE